MTSLARLGLVLAATCRFALCQEMRPAPAPTDELSLKIEAPPVAVELLEPLQLDIVLSYTGDAPRMLGELRREQCRLMLRSAPSDAASGEWTERKFEQSPTACSSLPAPTIPLRRKGWKSSTQLVSFAAPTARAGEKSIPWILEPGRYEMKVQYSDDQWATRIESSVSLIDFKGYAGQDALVYEAYFRKSAQPDFAYRLARSGPLPFTRSGGVKTEFLVAAEEIVRAFRESRFFSHAALLVGFDRMMPGKHQDVGRAQELFDEVLAKDTDGGLKALARIYRDDCAKRR